MSITPRAEYPEPASFIEQVGLSPAILSGYFITFLRSLLSDPTASISVPGLRKDKYAWKPTDQIKQIIETGILIESVTRYDPATAGKRPAILVARGDFSVGRKLSIGDRYQTPTNLLGDGHDPNYTATLGQNQQTIQINGQHIFFVISQEDGACEELATQLWHWLIDFKQIIRKDLSLVAFEVMDLARIKKLTEFKENWVIPVTVSYSYYRSAVLYSESPVLKAVNVEINK